MSPQFPNSGTVILMGTDKNKPSQVNNNKPHEDPKKKNGRFKRMLKKIFGRDHSTKQPYVVNNYNIFNVEGSINNQNNISMNKMDFTGPTYIGKIINQEIHKETIVTNQSSEEETKEDTPLKDDNVVDVDFKDVSTEPPQIIVAKEPKQSKKNNPHLSLKSYIADQKNADILLEWLHSLMDQQEYPKQKLLPLRAVSEAGYFSQRIPYSVYISEFGTMSRSSYYLWMKGPHRYDSSEIDALIEQISIKLPRFSN